MCYKPRPAHPPWFDLSKNIRGRERFLKQLIVQFSPAFYYFWMYIPSNILFSKYSYIIFSKYSSQHRVSSTHGLCFTHNFACSIFVPKQDGIQNHSLDTFISMCVDSRRNTRCSDLAVLAPLIQTTLISCWMKLLILIFSRYINFFVGPVAQSV